MSAPEFLSKFSDVTNVAKALAVDTRERDAVVAAAQVLIDEARSLQTRLGLLRAKNIDRVAEVHGTDWVAVTQALPADFVYNKTARLMTSKSRKAVTWLKDAAARAYTALNSTFGDSMQGPKDIDPVGLDSAVESVQTYLDGRHSDLLIDPASQTPSGTFRRAEAHLREHLRRARLTVASAVEAVEAFNRAEQFAREILENAQPAEVKAAPPVVRLEPLPDAPPSTPTTSLTQFDPREFNADPMPVDEIVVEQVGAGDGLRTRRAQTRKGR
jgi:hypothetical protein